MNANVSWNPELDKVTIAVREGESSHNCHEDTCCTVGAFAKEDLPRVFRFADNRQSNQSRNTI